MAKSASKILNVKGKKVEEILLKDKPGSAEIEKAVLGRSGTLRAPTLVRGKTVVAGFNEEVWSEVLGI